MKQDISKHIGIRRYTDSIQSRVSDSVVSDHDVVQCDKCKVLRAKLIGVTDSLLSALDDEQVSNFAVVENRKHRHASSACNAKPVQRSPTQPSFAAVAASRNTVNPPSVLPHHPQPGPAPTSPCPIPVVKIGAAARHAAEGAVSVQYAPAFFFFFFFLWNLSYRGAAIPLPVVRDHLNGNLPTTVPAPEV